MYPTHDYHGRSVEDALLCFVSDYHTALQSNAESKTFCIVHGYGSTGRGGKIKKVLRKWLTFEMSHGVLAFKESEQLDTHPGYTLVAPVRRLQSVPFGVLGPPLLLGEEYSIVQSINSAIDRDQGGKGRSSPAKSFGLDPTALNALNQLLPPEANERNRNV